MKRGIFFIFFAILFTYTGIFAQAALGAGNIDLDVTYISRTPAYPRYNVCYPSGNPNLCSDQTSATQRRPSHGETVTFTAHIKNKGQDPSGNFDYEWKIDGVAQGSGTLTSLRPGEEATSSLNWVWQNGSHLVEFNVDKSNLISEVSENNNKLSKYSDALQFRFHIEANVYNEFDNLLNFKGSYSFEDWIQGQIDGMRNEFSRSGINEKVRIDEIVIEPDGTLPRWGEHAPADMPWDGRWGFENTEWTRSKIQNEVSAVQGTLIHELTHQLGIIDSYHLNYDWNYAPNNAVIPKCASCDTGGSYCSGQAEEYQDCVYYNPNLADIMSGDYNWGYSPFVAGALNSNLSYRRGYYGEYMYDIPAQNTVIFLDANSAPLSLAEVYFYQKSGCFEQTKIPNAPVFWDVTNSQGEYALPNRPAQLVITETGHTKRDNPFGDIDVAGCNGVFLIKIIARGQTDYQWMDISQFSLAYWAGNTQSAIYTIKSDIGNAPVDNAPPVISSVSATNISHNLATITWATDEPSDSMVFYGITPGFSSRTPVNSKLTKAHSMNLTGFSPSTLYYYALISKDAVGNSTQSPTYSFTTAASPDTSYPVISSVNAIDITSNSATITWTTDEPSDSRVLFVTTAGLGTLTPIDPNLTNTHNMNLTGLVSSSLYNYLVISMDAAGNSQASSQYNFTTVPNQPPVLAAIGDKSVNEGTSFIFTVSASDADGDTLTYSATGLPSGATFRGLAFYWTPNFNQAGTYPVTFSVSDGTNPAVSETIAITVNDAAGQTLIILLKRS